MATVRSQVRSQIADRKRLERVGPKIGAVLRIITTAGKGKD